MYTGGIMLFKKKHIIIMSVLLMLIINVFALTTQSLVLENNAAKASLKIRFG